MLVAGYRFNPARMVPISLKITNPLEQVWLGEEIKIHYFGRHPIIATDLDTLRVSIFPMKW